VSAASRLSAHSPQRLEAPALAEACARAAREVAAAGDDRAAVDAALGLLYDAFGGDVLPAVFVREHDRLWLVAQRGYRVVPDGVPLDRGVIGRAVRTGKTQFVPVAADDSDYVAASSDVVSQLAVPVGDEDPPCALLNVETRLPLPSEAVSAFEALAAALGPRVDRLRGPSAPDISTLARLFVHSSTLRDVGAIGELAARMLARLLDLDAVQVNLGPPGRRHTVAASWSARPGELGPVPTDVVEELARSGDRGAVIDVRPLGEAAPDLAARSGLTTVVWLPLRASATEIGVLLGCSARPIELDRDRAEMCALLAAHVAASIDAAEALTRERRAAVTDPLTGVLNRRGLDERFDEELARATRDGTPFSVLVLDLDDFKEVNDRSGHEVGDRVLSSIGRYLTSANRAWDVTGRLGGDEFVILMPGTGGVAARAAAARLRSGFGETLERAGHRLAASIGIATFPDDGSSAVELLRSADRAMYRAKQQGSDRIVSFAELQRARASRAGDGDNVIRLPVRDAAPPGSRAPALRAVGDGVLGDIAGLTTAAAVVGQARTRDAMLVAGARELTQLLGAAAGIVSRLEGDLLVDAAAHEVVSLATQEDFAYDLADYPLTRRVLETGTPSCVSLGDEHTDPSEAFVLRELGMQAVLIAPLVTERGPWGIVEIYDARPRRFGAVDIGVAQFVVGQMAQRLEALESADAMERFHWETLASITSALEAKDASTSRHTEEVRSLAVELAGRLGMSPQAVRGVELGALLHDIGKIRVPEQILNKPGPLTAEEWEVMRGHPTAGERILAPISPLREVLPIVRSHHERWDGGGYPDGLTATDIPLGARVIAVCDAWRAMNEARPYREPLPRDEALAELRCHAGTQFDPGVVAIALELLGEGADAGGPQLHRPPA
jgi:diguanylate cyclase (GGDEF)-like protein/putative nucleotidyltransferase with HDIG domain